MSALKSAKLRLTSPITMLLPLALWGMLWFSLSAGDIRGISSAGSPAVFFHGLRATLPLAAGAVGVVIILAKMSRQPRRGILLLGPLGLVAVYGLVGIGSSLLSPNWPTALYWAGAYLSVPLVLWAIAWGPGTLDGLRRLINFNWLIIVLAIVALFAWALLYRNLGSTVLNLSTILECEDLGHRGLWYGKILRSTGVGRYAAIASIFALSLLWQPRWRFLSGFILLASLILLVTSCARGAIIPFFAVAPLVILLHGGKRAAVAAVLAVLILVALAWSTGLHDVFLDRWIFGGSWSAASNLTGRAEVWAAGWSLFKESPLFGFGFHADRLLLDGKHMHNAFMHALVQTGLMGTVPFVGALLWGWFLLFKALRNLPHLPEGHKPLLIQTGGVLAFLSLRAFPESTGAFFGVDLLLLAPLLLYVQVLNHSLTEMEQSG